MSPYRGREIPGWKSLGLDPDRTYRLLRPESELRAAAHTFRNLPLMRDHIPVAAATYARDASLVVGTVGGVHFTDPFLRGEICIWSQDSIDAVESGERSELSCGYHYKAGMRPGRHNGESYDGVMREIVGNHIALVDVGRVNGTSIAADRALSDGAFLRDFP